MGIGERLKFARQSMNFTLANIEERTGICVSALSEFENEKREPRLLQLKQLADIYHRSTGFFMEEGPTPVEVVLWRSKPTSPHVEVLQAKLLRLAEQYHQLERCCEDFEKLDLPFAHGEASHFSYSEAEILARDFRNKYVLGDRPGQSLLSVVEEVCKVKVFHMPFEPSGSAACTLQENFGAAILLNSKHVRWRRNFDLAHELFHLLTWNIFRKSGENTFTEAADQEEKLANCFAKHLLMPEGAFRMAIESRRSAHGKLTFDDLFEVARQFDVSIEALLWQMKFVFSYSEEWVKETHDKLKGQINFWDNRQHDEPPVRPIRFEALASEALRKGLISTGKYAEYLGITRREAMRQIEQEAYDDAEVEIAHP